MAAVTIVDQSSTASRTDDATDLLRSVYPEADVIAEGDRLSYFQRVRGDDRLMLLDLAVPTPVSVRIAVERVLPAGHYRRGRARVWSGDRQLDAVSPFLFGPGPAGIDSRGLEMQLLSLDEAELERFVAARAGFRSARLVVDGHAARSPRYASLWQRTVRYADAVLSSPEILRNDLIRSQIVDMVFSTAVEVFPITVHGRRAAHSTAAGSAVVRRALAFIDDNLSNDVDVADIAEAARIGVRGLQEAFRRHLDTTPNRALRNARLSAAHEELAAQDPDVVAVGDVARRWKFAHLGRFAASYREEYGELPSETLQCS